MIKSMTGFGRCEIQNGSRKFTVELKSVNHRYLDVNIRMPKKLNFFETAIRTLLKSYANRGKVDIFITYEDLSQSQVSVKYNAVLAAEYLKYLRQMEEEFGLENDIRVSTLSRYPEVFTMEEQSEDEEELWNGLKEALEGAFGQFVETRKAEGENLKKDILSKLDFLETEIVFVEERSPQIVAEYRAKLEEKMKELLADTQIEDSRIAAEVILFADKICTDEEVVRLKSHIRHMRATLEEKDQISSLTESDVTEKTLCGSEIKAVLSKSPYGDFAIGGVKIATDDGWVAARPSGTEDLYKLYAESFVSQEQAAALLEEGKALISKALAK